MFVEMTDVGGCVGVEVYKFRIDEEGLFWRRLGEPSSITTGSLRVESK